MIKVVREGNALTITGRARYSYEDEYSACPALAQVLYVLCESVSERRTLAGKGERFAFSPGPAFETICACDEALTVNYGEHVYYEQMS